MTNSGLSPLPVVVVSCEDLLVQAPDTVSAITWAGLQVLRIFSVANVICPDSSSLPRRGPLRSPHWRLYTSQPKSLILFVEFSFCEQLKAL
jgi:hypothetical protein